MGSKKSWWEQHRGQSLAYRLLALERLEKSGYNFFLDKEKSVKFLTTKRF
jgi:hypothetical protein